MKELRIVFMGTPEFAVTILDRLVKNGANVVGVITAPDKPAGRGLQMNESAVKQYAVQQQLHVLQPVNLKDEAFIAELRDLHADLFVVVAFRMLPEIVWSMPPKGTINLHGSILPNYRGAAPINWAVINGEKETGVTTFFIEKEIDTGKVIERNALAIGENETVGELHDRLMELGAQTTLSTVIKIAEGNVEGIPQLELTDGELKAAPKIFKGDCEVNFNQPVANVHDFIRGLSPYPAAWCTLHHPEEGKRTFKLFRCLKTIEPVDASRELKATKDGILFPCSDFYLLVTELQPEGKRKMDFKAYLAGNSVENWSVQ
ncbi:MAG: methionyl-tRNA formyltransferase [Crocinitomicaceae bacterium]|nr:methionyl-tRNA formyltransferase [Crocinitomicaceae bacterium]NGF75707.1 methionyl-tRNA formyltransferase [Fluviicola sp. SGL-29]